jgi:phosphoribosyl-ATP pyrophosphohydrolase/phosphoribosyl-AMP cyclohydrolase
MTDSQPLTDRRITEPGDLDRLQFNEAGLVPVVTQDADTGSVLMLAWANPEALALTLASGRMTYWSRSRQEIWTKGETSGNTQELVSLHSDCDGDTVLARVRPAGPACHTNEATCFGEGASADAAPSGAIAGPGPAAETTLPGLWATLQERAITRPEGSYTVRLLDDENLRIKKLGEETAELIQALLKAGSTGFGGGDREVGDTEAAASRGRAAEEAADLIYHALAALLAAGVSLDEVLDELEKRR